MKIPGLELEPNIPAFWGQGGHPQTIIAHLLPSLGLQTRGSPIRIDLPDGDFLTGREYEGSSGVQVILFHGLGGTADADYMQRTGLLAQKLGHTVTLVNHRGCGEGRGTARGIYHSGRADDVSQAIAWVKNKNPRLKTIAIGFSLSGNALLLRLAGGRKGFEKDLHPNGLPDAAIAVNPPVNLARAGQRLAQGLNRIYDFRFILQCKRDLQARERAGLLPAGMKERVQIPWTSTLTDFDEVYTAPLGGFKNAADYYASCSTQDRLEEITTPTVMITAEDDPFVSVEDFKVLRRSSAVKLHIERQGGHVGYLSGRVTPYGTNRWLDYALDRSIGYLLETVQV